MQHELVDCVMQRWLAAIEIEESSDNSNKNESYNKPPFLQPLRHIYHPLGKCRKLRAEAVEQVLELGDHENKQYRGNHNCYYNNCRRVNQGLLDL